MTRLTDHDAHRLLTETARMRPTELHPKAAEWLAEYDAKLARMRRLRLALYAAYCFCGGVLVAVLFVMATNRLPPVP